MISWSSTCATASPPPDAETRLATGRPPLRRRLRPDPDHRGAAQRRFGRFLPDLEFRRFGFAAMRQRRALRGRLAGARWCRAAVIVFASTARWPPTTWCDSAAIAIPSPWACRSSILRRSRWRIRGKPRSATRSSSTEKPSASARCRWATRTRWWKFRISIRRRSPCWAPSLQSSGAFPQSANIGFAQVVARDRLHLRVYERGVGETLACGSGACAAAAILIRRGTVDRDVRVSLPGGDLQISWPDDAAEVIMSGPATFVFEGDWKQ